jgi:hypothetical protein
MIDYIFYSRQLLRTVGLLGPLDAEWIKSNKVVGFPHPHVPSDHLPLMVELELTYNNSNNNISYNNRAGQQQQLHSQHHLNSSSNGSSMSGQLGIGQMIPINSTGSNQNNSSSSSNQFLRK